MLATAKLNRRPTQQHCWIKVLTAIRCYRRPWLNKIPCGCWTLWVTSGLTADEAQPQLINHYIRGYAAKRIGRSISLDVRY